MKRLRLEPLEARTLLAVNVLGELQESLPNSSNPGGFVQVGETVYFSAREAVPPGNLVGGLWRTDGTPEGTRRVDTLPEGFRRIEFATENELVVIAAGQRWRTDGSSAGTYLLGDEDVDVTLVDGRLILAEPVSDDSRSPVDLVEVDLRTGDRQILIKEFANVDFTLDDRITFVQGKLVAKQKAKPGQFDSFKIVRIEEGESHVLSEMEFARDFVRLEAFDGFAYFFARPAGSDRSERALTEQTVHRSNPLKASLNSFQAKSRLSCMRRKTTSLLMPGNASPNVIRFATFALVSQISWR